MAFIPEEATGDRDYKFIENFADEIQMRGLINCRADFGTYKPLEGAKVSISTHHYTSHFTKTLTQLGAQLQCCHSRPHFNLNSKEDDYYWRCIDRALDWGHGVGPDLIVDDCGDATLFIYEGVKAEKIYAQIGQLPDPSSIQNAQLQRVFSIIGDGLGTHPMRFHHMIKTLVGISVGTITGVERLYQMQAHGILSFPTINIHHSVTNSKYMNLYGSRHTLLDGIKRATNMTIYGKRALVCGYDEDDASEGCAIALKQAGADVFVYDVDPIHALRASLMGLSVIHTLHDCVPETDIFVTNINNYLFNHVKRMKNNAIIYIKDAISLDHNDNNTYADPLEQYFSGMRHIMVDPQTDKWVSYETNSSIMVLRNKGCPILMSSWSCTSHVVAMLDLWSKRGTGKYGGKVYDLPEHLEEKVSALHLGDLRAARVTPEKETNGQGGRHHVFVAKKSDEKRIFFTVVQASIAIVMVVLGVVNSSKVGIDLPFPKSPLDFPFSAIWG